MYLFVCLFQLIVMNWIKKCCNLFVHYLKLFSKNWAKQRHYTIVGYEYILLLLLREWFPSFPIVHLIGQHSARFPVYIVIV